MLDVVEKWERTGLLSGVPSERLADMAYMLENQRIYNPTIVEHSKWQIPQFMRISIPLARRVFPCLESHQRHKVESKLGLESCLYKITGLAGPWTESQYDGHGGHNLDVEAHATSLLADNLREHVDKFIESQAPFNTFYVQALGLDDEGKIILYYDLD